MMMINVAGDEDYDKEPMRRSRFIIIIIIIIILTIAEIIFPFIIFIMMMMMLAEMKSMIRNQCAGLAMARAQ